MPKTVRTKSMSETSTHEKINASFSENALKMMRKRYLLKRSDGTQESPAEMFQRIAHALASIEKKYGKDTKAIAKTEREFFDVMSKKQFTPAGRTITNAGASTPVVANCIVLPVLDSMESIFQTLKDASLLQQAGSGLGFDFSHLRPAMTRTKKSNGVASGPVSFLRVYNEAFSVIKQQGRHGANMAMMQVDHPDVLDFIRSKEVEGEIRNFNVSVKITDAFMRELIERPNEQWYCEWNGVKTKPHNVRRAPNGSVIGTEEISITVKQLFDELVHYAWRNGEPGIVFIDEVNRTNPLPGLGAIDCSNPCVAGDTLVPTEKGLLKIEELAERYGDGNILIAVDHRTPGIIAHGYEQNDSVLGYAGHAAVLTAARTHLANRFTANPMLRAWRSGIKPVYELETMSGYSITATSDHKILTTEGKVELSKLTATHRILTQPAEGLWNSDDRLPVTPMNKWKGVNGHTYQLNLPSSWSKELGQALGWLVGDGWLRNKAGEERVGFVFAKEDAAVGAYLKPIINSFYGNSIQEITRPNGVAHLSYGARPFVAFFESLGVKTGRAETKRVPHTVFTASRDAVVGFLQGLFTADGTVGSDSISGNRYIRLTAKSKRLLQDVQILLANFGIASRIYDRSRAPRITFHYTKNNGERRDYMNDGVLYELNISKNNVPRFLNTVTFLAGKHEHKVQELRRHTYYSQLSEDSVRRITYRGMQPVYDLTEPFTATFIGNGITVSNCGEQFLHHYDNCNLGSMNLAAFAEDRRMDWEGLRRATKIATRFLDNVIDTFDFPVKQVTALAQKNRRVGLGIMGFADMLYKLGIGYNSEEGRSMGEQAMKTVTDAAHEMSRELAKEKGAFPNIEKSIFAEKGFAMRNAALTTVAPTGSISMFTDCSSGVEPNFALAYVKQDKDGHQYHYLNAHFAAALKKYNFSDERMKAIKDELVRTGSIQGLMDVPEELRKTFVVAMDISARDHILMQAAFQRHVDNSISKTINFPNSATQEDVYEGFVTAWKLKCKACTVYRDGSRNVQILNLGTGENIKSPTELGKGGITAPANVVTEPPLNLEIDKGKIEARNRPDVMAGKTYKMKTGYGNLYVTINNDETGAPFEVFATIGKSGGFFQEQSEAICRLISLSLRSGVKVEAVINDLKGIRGPMPVMTNRGTVLSLPDAIGQILEEHVRGEGIEPDTRALAEEVVRAQVGQEAIPSSPAAASAEKKKSIAEYGFMPGCPECGAALKMAEGCMSCTSCGFSRCV